jgi:hypothetical protein
VSGVQEAEVARVEVALDSLQPIASALQSPTALFVGRGVELLEVRKRRGRLARAHVGPHNATRFDTSVGVRPDLPLEVATPRFVRHVHTGTGGIELPPVVDAADPVALTSPEVERGPTMRAVLRQDAHAPARVTERYEVLPQQSHPQRVRVLAT